MPSSAVAVERAIDVCLDYAIEVVRKSRTTDDAKQIILDRVKKDAQFERLLRYRDSNEKLVADLVGYAAALERRQQMEEFKRAKEKAGKGPLKGVSGETLDKTFGWFKLRVPYTAKRLGDCVNADIELSLRQIQRNIATEAKNQRWLDKLHKYTAKQPEKTVAELGLTAAQFSDIMSDV